MHRLWMAGVGLLISAAAMFAQGQIATASSSEPFQLHGALVKPGQGVPFWPVMSGDLIQAGTEPVTIRFRDGSTIILAAGSDATLTLDGTTPVFNLTAGSAEYQLRTSSTIELEALGSPLAQTSAAVPAGEYSVRVPARKVGGAPKITGGFWTTSHLLWIIGGAAAAAGIAFAAIELSSSGGPQATNP